MLFFLSFSCNNGFKGYPLEFLEEGENALLNC